ncbi:MAG TPA: NfeD family protein [Egibacteraceae bacterium]|nr:NfeD family protein [Egibacteraceae bacterium]
MIPPVPRGRHWAARRLSAALLLAGLVVGLASAAAAQPTGRLVDVIEVHGVVDATVAGYLEDRLDRAASEDSEVVIVSLDTPGGLGVDPARVVEAVTSSQVPVVVWVGPPGATATGLGMHLAYAGHVLAMAPATTIGDVARGDLREPAATDLDTAEAQLLELARTYGRDERLATEAVRNGAVVAIGEVELPPDVQLPAGIARDDVTVVSAGALDERPVADLVAASLPELLVALDGREVTAAGGPRTLSIDQSAPPLRFNNLGLVGRVLHTVANPTLAYLLLVGGALALLFEVFQPGFGVAGVTGIGVIALGVYGLAVLPTNWWAFALIAVGLALLAADLAIARLGVLTAAGTVALAAGSFWLYGGSPLVDVSAWVIVPVVAFAVVFFVGIMTTVLRAQGNQAMAGAEAMAGKVGVVRSMLNPEGHIFVGGALWRARAPEELGKVKTGTKVRVLGMNDRLTLDVEVVDEGAEEQAPVG